jgi:peptidoglycan/LPS O-acetylase OafA/YrhL
MREAKSRLTTNSSADNSGTMVAVSQYYHPELDVLRFFAFLSVFFHHLIPQDPAAYTFSLFRQHIWLVQATRFIGNFTALGLPIFFFLSAFLISTLMIIEAEKTQTIHLLSFYIRRILRIWPLYYFAVLLCLAISVFRRDWEGAKLSAAFALFVGNWYDIIHPNGQVTSPPFWQLWSISVEEQFYVVFPILALLVKRQTFIVIGGCAIIVSLVVLYVIGGDHVVVMRDLWANGFCQSIFFGAGILSSVWIQQKKVELNSMSRSLIFSMAIGMYYVATRWFDIVREGLSRSGLHAVAGYVSVAIGTSLLLISIYGLKLKFPKALIFLGKISFGLYVFHVLSMEIFAHEKYRLHLEGIQARFISLSLTILLAILSYKWLERPFLKLKSRFAFIKTRRD